ncbi:MAG: 16S rRNA (cytidine(1402)-2'-O)-methyltransferase [Byssovorax sp.]
MSASGQGTSGRLFVVATPIGNLGDITLRAIETLRAADRVLAEDTRRTRALLSHLGITGKSVDRLDAHAEQDAIPRVIERLLGGESVALCTDAGTPIVSDPGALLIQAAIQAGVPVVPIPGASAVLAALALSGLGAGGFRFLGFLPRSGPERREAIARVDGTPEAVVLFESPQRLDETLRDLAAVMPAREAVVARELTKLHEEATRGTLGALAAAEAREWLGEVTLVLGPRAEAEAEKPSDDEIARRIQAELARGRRAKDVAEELSLTLGVPKREMYARVVALKEKG